MMAEPLAVLTKNRREEIRVDLETFKGHDLFAARVWFEGDDGNKRPGKSGLSFRVGLLPEFIKAASQAEAEAKKRGLLP